MTIPKLDPINLEVFVLQNRNWLAVWCGPRGKKIGHWFLYRKGKHFVLRARIHEISRKATLDELVPFAGPPDRVYNN